MFRCKRAQCDLRYLSIIPMSSRYEEALGVLSCSDPSIIMADIVPLAYNGSTVVRDLSDASTHGNSTAITAKNSNYNNSSSSGNNNSSDNNSSNSSNSDSNSSTANSTSSTLPSPPVPIPLSPQRVQLLSALYERTGRTVLAKELLQRAALTGLSSQSDMGESHSPSPLPLKLSDVNSLACHHTRTAHSSAESLPLQYRA